MRYAVKSAPPPGGEPLQFVMSDGSIDRMGDVIEPSGWQLQHFKKNPIALFNHDPNQVIGRWANVRVENKQLRGELVPAEQGTSPLVDYVRSLITQGILRTVSVGFRPLEKKPLNDDDDKSSFWGPFRFLKNELLECSLVAVPANANALNVAKTFGIPDEYVAELFRKTANDNPPRTLARLPNISGHQGTKMKTLSQQIEDARKALNELRDMLTELVNKGDERTDDEQVQYQELPDRITRQQAALDTLERAEKALAARTEPAQRTQGRQEVIPPAPAVINRLAPAVQPRDHLVRAMAVHFLAKMHQRSVADVLRERYPHDEGTEVVLRAAVAPAMTTVAGWAAELVNTAVADFLNQLPVNAIYPRIAGKGPRFTFGNNGVIKVPGRSATPKINGSFVGEGQPIPVRKLGLAAITLTPKKMAVISEFTREMGNASTPAIEGVIRQAINEDTSEAIDTVLIDNVAADTIRPAGLRNGVSGLTPSVLTTTFEKIVADIKALMAPIVAARGGRDLVLLCNPAQALGMSWAVAPNGTFVFADGGAPQMRQITVVSSITVPAGMLIMLDAADFASVTGDTPEFDVSDVATIHEEDTTPLPIGTAGSPAVVAAPVRSLWQTASIGVRMLLDMNWAMRRTGMVSWMTGVTW